MADIAGYLEKVIAKYKTGDATEHSYRSALEQLFDSVETGVTALNEPKAVKVGRPDFVFQRMVGTDQITVGHAEAKDIGLDINPKAMNPANRAQFERYVKALPNLIYTNGLDFRFYKEGELVREISIADYLMGIQPKPDQFEALANQLRDFCAERLQTITGAERLAEMMAGKAVLIKDILFNTLKEDKDLQSELAGQYQAFKDQLIHDLSVEEFSDIYSETIAYGMFAARLHDETREDFSREEALTLLPKSNPFLRKLFEFVAGPGLDDAIRRTVDELAEVFQATDLQKLFENFGSFTQRNDPFIHFYETFLAKYNPKKRKARGVWYTPEPVVNFIVRAVDEVLQSEFGLKDGLADTSKVNVTYEVPDGARPGKWSKKTESMHRVQILDPAAGTGTFLAEVIKQIAPKIRGVAPGKWSSYVEKELIPRLHGFEILMASYAMCHMKLDMMLTEMGYRPTMEAPRFSVYLTNSLEEGEREVPDLFMARWLSEEARLANNVKNDKPIMCVIGNPPYLGEGGKSEGWLGKLMDDYKKEPGGKEKLKERNPKWINDLYVKFIRMSSHLIEKNGEGVLGFITNHGYLDNPTFRGMRWHLLKTFDEIRVLDLHGNAKKKEVAPDGSPDKNVFDIQQGVAIIVATKKKHGAKSEKPLAKVWHGELWGSRKGKYRSLGQTNREALSDTQLTPHPKYQMFYSVNNELLDIYDVGFSVAELFRNNQIGITTSRDHLAVGFDWSDLAEKISFFTDGSKSESEVREFFFSDKSAKAGFSKGDTANWSLEHSRRKLRENGWEGLIKPLDYRPFDQRNILYSEHILERMREEIAPALFEPSNYALAFNRKIDEVRPFSDVFVFRNAPQLHSLSIKESNYFAPLYYVDDLDQSIRVNMDEGIRRKIEEAAMGKTSPLVGEDVATRQEGGNGVDVGETPPSALSGISPTRGEIGVVDIQPRYADDGRPNEVAIFDYIYGVLHCPAYRETYKEFLKIDFPRIPYPPSPEVFRDVQEKGTELRRLHLMEDEAIGETPYPFTGEGDSVVGKVRHEGGAVFINDTQCFENVPEIAWSFYIGGYQPAQKWLKDRKGRELSFDDIRHYQKIVKILSETDRIMKTIAMPLGD